MGRSVLLDGIMKKDAVHIPKKNLLSVLKWKLKNRSKAWPKWVENRSEPSFDKNVKGAHLTHINHSTVLIRLQELTILTDPVYSYRVGPLSWLGPRRFQDPGVSFETLPKIDVVLLSHNHYDHMDLPTLKRLKERDDPLFILPVGNAPILHARGMKNTLELNLWQKHVIKGLEISLTSAQHWSRRGFFDYCRGLWGGYYLQSKDLKIFFAGDTGYGAHFQEIRERFGSPHVSFLPIGAYEPRWFMKESHMDPADAVEAHLDLGSSFSMGIHFGTFKLSDEGIDDPICELHKNLALKKIPQEKFIVPRHGQTVLYSP
jgi:L-ascorbate metabolism protein UlaG (beta-lactamase superfamily)